MQFPFLCPTIHLDCQGVLALKLPTVEQANIERIDCAVANGHVSFALIIEDFCRPTPQRASIISTTQYKYRNLRVYYFR